MFNQYFGNPFCNGNFNSLSKVKNSSTSSENKNNNANHNTNSNSNRIERCDTNTVNNNVKRNVTFGIYPLIINIDKETLANKKYKTTIWAGKNMEVMLMCINPGESVGICVNNEKDQFIRIEEGFGVCVMGTSKGNMNYRKNVYDGYAIMIPKGIWSDVLNLGNKPMKIYSIYAKNIQNKKSNI